MASTALKVSSEFAISAREAAEAADRSLTGQVEHWAKLGRAAERILPAHLTAALKQCGAKLDEPADPAVLQRILEALAAIPTTSPDVLRRAMGLDRQTLYEADADRPDGLVRIAPDGTRMRGVLKGRKFIPTP